MKNILITGVGGQGTVILSRIIGEAALSLGHFVRGTETIGMAQRGGSVVSHLRIGEGSVSPLILPGEADLIIAFEPAEGVRVLPFLRKGGTIITLDKPLQPVSATLSGGYDVKPVMDFLRNGEHTLYVISGEMLLGRISSEKSVNVALLEAAIEVGQIPVTAEAAAEVIKNRLPKRFLDANLEALKAGADIVKEGI